MKILLFGRNGQLGARLARALPALGNTVALGRDDVDLADPDRLRSAIREVAPALIVNAAAYTAVDRAETERELAMRINGAAPGVMGEEAKRCGALLVHYSTDYVFDGMQSRAYTEEDACRPLNHYGASKLAGEEAVKASGCDHLVLRTSWVYDSRGENFVLTMLRLARERQALRVVSDQTGSPTWAHALSETTLALLRAPDARQKTGLYHLAAEGSVSRYELARAVVREARRLTGRATGWADIVPVTSAEYPLPARRPLTCVMSKARVARAFDLDLSTWEEQLAACMSELQEAGGL